MIKKTKSFRYYEKDYVIDEFLNDKFICIKDLVVLTHRSRKKILEFCKKNSIPVMLCKENSKIAFECVDYTQFQEILIQSSQVVSTKPLESKKLTAMSNELSYNMRKRALDLLKTKSWETYIERHLSKPEHYYRALGLVINVLKYYKVNISKTELNKTYDVSHLATGSAALSDIDEKMTNLKNFIKTHGGETKNQVIKTLMQKRKLVPNEQFWTIEELESLPELQEVLDELYNSTGGR